jgi:myo-inositol-1-phosphate synthase
MTKLISEKPVVKKPEGRLGILLPGMGAVATTFIAGVEAVRRGIAEPIGSLTQMGHIRLGKRTESRQPKVNEFVPLQALDQIVFGGWDIFEDDCLTAARRAGVLESRLLDQIGDFLGTIRPMKAAFDPEYIKRISGPNVIPGGRRDWANQVRKDIRDFKAKHELDRVVLVWCGSTETYTGNSEATDTLAGLEKGLDANDSRIPPSLIYAYAAMMEGCPFANGAPNFSADAPAILELADKQRLPLCGKDFKTGQTLMKTIIAPGLKARLLGLQGWFSTNILGNRDGEVLEDPGSFRSKEVTKLSVLDTILQPELYPTLYGNFFHSVKINYYPPRGDNKEGWDNIDITGWLGYPMQIKIDFLCRDSILAAPLVLDLALFMDFAQRSGFYGIQEWLSFYFKSPMAPAGLYPEHDLFIQLTKLKNTLRFVMGEELITHLGLDYYSDES